MLYRWTKAETAEDEIGYRIKLPKEGLRWNLAPKSKPTSWKPSALEAHALPGHLPAWLGSSLGWHEDAETWVCPWLLSIYFFLLNLHKFSCAVRHVWSTPDTLPCCRGKEHSTILNANKSWGCSNCWSTVQESTESCLFGKLRWNDLMLASSQKRKRVPKNLCSA